MLISISLDGPKERDFTLFQGDDQWFTLAVYEHDGDATQLAVSNPRIRTAHGSLPVHEQFMVPSIAGRRLPYELLADIDGAATVLAYGLIVREGVGEPDFATPGFTSIGVDSDGGVIGLPDGDLIYDGGHAGGYPLAAVYNGGDSSPSGAIIYGGGA